MLSTVLEQQNTARMDAEFFQRNYLINDALLARKATSRLVDIAQKIDVGFVGSMTANYCEDGIPLLQTKNIAPFLVQDGDTVKINAAFHLQLEKSQIRYEDILIARSGSFGKASIYLKDQQTNSSDIIIIQMKNNCVSPYFLTAFLNTTLGSAQMIRFASGGLQGHVNLTILEELRVPILSNDFQVEIERVIRHANQALEAHGALYGYAENVLITAIDVAQTSITTGNLSVKSFSASIGKTGRLDAEYFQPKYDRLLVTLSRDSMTIGDVAPARHDRFQNPGTGDFEYIEIGGMLGDGTVAGETVSCAEAPSRASQKVRSGDIVTSTVRPIRRLSALILKDQDNHVCSSGFVVLQPKHIAAEVLLVYLRLPVICELMDLHTSASLYPAISEKDLLGLPMPKIALSVQQEISTLVRESFTLKAQSQQLLEAAKRAVEIAIEQNEAAGMAYLAQKGVLP